MFSSYLFIICILISSTILAHEEYIIVIKDHHFIPHKLAIPAGTKVKLIIDNQDDEVEEFESLELHREKIIPPHGKIKMKIGPLEPGEYKFFGDFHSQTAQGIIVAE